MDHEKAKSLFINYHDGDLPDGDRAALEGHLGTCPDCRVEWEAYRKTVGEISVLRVVSLPEDFATRVSCAIEQRERRRLIGHLSFLNVRAIFLLIVLIMLFMMVYLAWLLFSASGTPGASAGGASAHDRDDVHIIGPIKNETQPEPADGR